MSYHFHHICVYYDEQYRTQPLTVFDDKPCWLADMYFHLSAIDQYLGEINDLATALHRKAEESPDHSVAA